MENKNNKTLIILIIVLALLVIGLGGYVIYDKLLSDNTVNENNLNNEENNQNDTNQENNLNEEGIFSNWRGQHLEISEMGGIVPTGEVGDVLLTINPDYTFEIENNATIPGGIARGKLFNQAIMGEELEQNQWFAMFRIDESEHDSSICNDPYGGPFYCSEDEIYYTAGGTTRVIYNPQTNTLEFIHSSSPMYVFQR